ncbi:hypothetical protein [Lacinutrix salivirga]
MGVEGAMMQANQSNKYNKSLIERRKKDKDLTRIYAHIKVEFPESKPEEVIRIRKKMQVENKNRLLKRVLLFVVLCTVLLLLLTL